MTVVHRTVIVTRTYNVLAEESYVDQLADFELSALIMQNYFSDIFKVSPIHSLKVEIVKDTV